MYKSARKARYHTKSGSLVFREEICAYLGISRDTLLTWISEKGLPAHKMRHNWKSKTADVDEWVKSGKAG